MNKYKRYPFGLGRIYALFLGVDYVIDRMLIALDDEEEYKEFKANMDRRRLRLIEKEKLLIKVRSIK